MATRVFERRTKPADMLDGRRRAWRKGPDLFRVYGRQADAYDLEVVNGEPRHQPDSECKAAEYGLKCWHVDLVKARLEREASARPPEPSIDELFAMAGGAA